MKKILFISIALVTVLLTAGMASAHGWTYFGVGVSLPLPILQVVPPPAVVYSPGYPPSYGYYSPGYYAPRVWVPGYWGSHWTPYGWRRVWVRGYWR